MNSAIHIRHLSVYYGAHCALKDINLNIESGDFLAVIGPNGGGKSTLLKAILGLLSPTEGKISYESSKPIGYVPQHSAFDKNFPMTVQQAILLGGLENNFRPFWQFDRFKREKAQQLMEKFSLTDHAKRLIGQLSGGQLQKVLIARALMGDPTILLLDEPTASLDAHAKNDIYEWLSILNREKTIVLVSHDMMAVSPYIKNIACLNKTLHYHGKEEYLKQGVLEQTYGCPIELLGHGDMPHRILSSHEGCQHDSSHL